jgi:hypothetical protein
LHEPIRPWPARSRRRPARRRCGGGHRRCGWRRAWRRSRRSNRRRLRRRNRSGYDTASTTAAGRLWPGIRLPARTRAGRLWLWLSIRAPSERLRLPASPATRLPLLLASGRFPQPGGVDLIRAARCRAFAAGGKFFPTADASIRRGWLGRGAEGVGSIDGCRPPIAGMPGPQSPDRLTSTLGGAPVPGSE